ncbi:MAG: hypothetical protein D6814_05780 [Calditrichaeota bacterium]|nr:MAG: hypothetical protein D6814_05780 [Calditrichota bacterium]
MFIRFILWLIIFYLAYRLIKNWISQPPPKREVKGKPKNKPLDLSDADVEDAKFRELHDESKREPKG